MQVGEDATAAVATCARCGEELDARFRFCPSCGAPVAVASVQERKVISVLFCDVVGFTAASEASDIEDVRTRMAAYYRAVRPVLESFGGTVDKFIGDAVMAVFGVPTAREDDALRAVRAGLAVVEAVAALNEAQPGLDLAVRVGVNTGEVLVSLGESAQLGEGVVLGDTVNTAARIQSAAPVGGVAIGQATRAAVGERIACERLADISAKGKAEPVPVWRAVSASHPSTSRVAVDRSPLVGREEELALLLDLFAEVSTTRQVRAVTIVGEPGIGKSRLLAELERRLASLTSPPTWCVGQCVSYGAFGFSVLADIVADAACLTRGATGAEIDAALDAALGGEPDEVWLRSRLRPLLEGGAGDASPVEQHELFTAWSRFLGLRAEQRPLVVVVEDLHWADPSLGGFAHHLATAAAEVPILVVCSSRPDGEAEPVGRTLSLGPLADRQIAAVIGSVLGSGTDGSSVPDSLIERAGGNPLFAEELARIEREGHDASVPASLGALITARLDGLPPSQRQVVLAAAVMGSTFWPGALAHLTGRPALEVEEALDGLVARGMVRPSTSSSVDGEPECSFRHALVRDAAYQLLPRRARAEQHLAAARWLAALDTRQVDLLAHHSWEAYSLASAAGDQALASSAQELAAEWALLAGERTVQLDPTAAFTQLERARQLCDAGSPLRGRVLLRWGQTADSVGRLADGVRALEEAVPLLIDQGDRVGAAQALADLDMGLWWLGDPQADGTLTLRAIELLADHPGPYLFHLQSTMARELTRLGDPAAGKAAAEAIVDEAVALGFPPPPPAVMVIADARCHLGDPGGVAAYEQAVELYVADGQIAHVTTNLAVLGELRWVLEGPSAGCEQFARAEAWGRRYGVDRPATRGLVLPALVQAGRLREAVAAAEALLPALRDGGGGMGEVYALSALLHARAELGEVGHDDLLEVPVLVGLAARSGGHEELSQAVWGAAPALLVARDPGSAGDLVRLVATAEMIEARRVSGYGRWLPGLARAAAAVVPDALEVLADRVPDHVPIAALALATVRAQLAERDGALADAAGRFEECARGWAAFGAPLEAYHALAGQARCLAAIGDSQAIDVEQAAGDLFSRMAS